MSRRPLTTSGRVSLRGPTRAPDPRRRHFGAVAAAASSVDRALAAPRRRPAPRGAPPHFGRARERDLLYMDGGPAQMDTFDPKPGSSAGTASRCRSSPADAVQRRRLDGPHRGRSGRAASGPRSRPVPEDPRAGGQALRHPLDGLEVPRAHRGRTTSYTGHSANGPSVGAWVPRPGSVAEDLPGYVVVDGGLVPGSLECYGSGFLNPRSRLRVPARGPACRPPRGARTGSERGLRRRALLDGLDGLAGRATAASTRRSPTTVACRMQVAVPGLADISNEPAA